MNAVEIEEAVSALAAMPFDAESFPYAFLEAFGNKETTIKRLRSGETNQSDVPGGVLQRNNIHLKTCPAGEVAATLALLRESSATARYKAKFILATDGKSVEAENLLDGETVACDYEKFSDHFGFFLALAGISTVREIRENAFDIKATSRLNKLYVELLKVNPDWDTAERQEALNHFFARLIFCFFAEDTNIFGVNARFTSTVEQMSAPDASNTHEVLAELFRSMNMKPSEREAIKIRSWAMGFPYVNGGLFSDSLEVPKFSKIARSYLIHVGNLDWTKINPDIFGSMIQAVADNDERGELGMHYTSVPNILKVLNPLFLDDLRAQLGEAGDNARKLLNLRNRMARIRVFDPACGSGNFLVIAYKEMRAIEAEVNRRRNDRSRRTEIPLTNFRGIELRNFSAEIARLALVIAEYQCDVIYRGQEHALAEVLPLEAANWITCGNALRLDWLSICPSTGTGVKLVADDLFSTSLSQAEIDFENEGGETYICGNPPYVWTNDQSEEQKNDLKNIFASHTKAWKSLNYVSAWFKLAADYIRKVDCESAFVSINTVCQGQHVSALWPSVLKEDIEIGFAHTSFKWSNLASNNAGVTVVIVGLRKTTAKQKRIFQPGNNGETDMRHVSTINAYLAASRDIIVNKCNTPISAIGSMVRGNMPYDGGHLLLSSDEAHLLIAKHPASKKFLKRILGSAEMIKGQIRYCLWIDNDSLSQALEIPEIAERIKRVEVARSSSADKGAKALAARSHQFREMNFGRKCTIAVPAVSSESREFLTADLLSSDTIITNRNYGLYDDELLNFALLASTLHLVWVSTVCGRLELRLSYTNTLGWNTFPVPTLTEQNKADLTRRAVEILIARETHFPATIADLYEPEDMPPDLREAHERNDETLERIYIGRRFKNDTERLEKLFELYTKMSSQQRANKVVRRAIKGAVA